MAMKALKIIALVFGVLLLLAGGGVAWLVYKARNMEDTRDLERQVAVLAEKARTEAGIPHLAVVVVQRGRTHLELSDGVEPTSLFEIGSITKVFTAMATQRLVEAGDLDWDDHVFGLLPDGLRPPSDDGTTLRHLATHTSGLPRLPPSFLESLNDTTCDPYAALTRTDIWSAYARQEGKRAPADADYDYSNWGMGLLGHLLEERTGIGYPDLATSLVLDPLRMDRTYAELPDSLQHQAMTGHDAGGAPTCPWHFGALGPAGQLWSTAEDLQRFLLAALDSTHALAPAFRSTMQAERSFPGGRIGLGWHEDRLSGALFGIPRIVWHNGGTGGFSSYLAVAPDNGFAVAVLANKGDVNGTVDRLGMDILLRANHISLADGR